MAARGPLRENRGRRKYRMPVRRNTCIHRLILAGASAFLVVLLVLYSRAFALAPDRRISQYAHTAWRIQDGYFSGTPQTITQTKDGYLWIGTQSELVRFDGVRFVAWTAPNGKQLPSSFIHSLLGASDGSLWIGTSRGLAHWTNGDLVVYSATSDFIEAVLQDSKGVVWITRSRVHDPNGPLCQTVGNILRCYGAADGIPFPYAQPLFQDAQGSLWLGSSLGVCSWTPGKPQTFTKDALAQFKGLQGVSSITGGADGSVLVGIQKVGQGLGLQQLREGVWKEYAVPGLRGDSTNVSALFTDRAGDLWVGTANNGLYRVHAGRADHFGSADGLSSDAVQGFYEDHEGNLWVATSRGIDRFHDTPVVTYSIHEGLTSEDVDSVLVSRDGTVWVGNVQGLDVLHAGRVAEIGRRNGLPGNVITSLLEARDGRLWAGVDSGLTVYDHGHFRWVNRPGGKPVGVVVSLAEDPDGSIWAATTQPSLVHIRDSAVHEELVPPQVPRVSSIASDSKEGIWLGLWSGALARYRHGQLETLTPSRPNNSSIRNLLVESDGSAWGATHEGLFRWKERQMEVLGAHNGLPCDDIYASARDNHGTLWLDTQCGFIMIQSRELERWWREPDTQVQVKTLDVFDGAQPGLTNFRPEISKAPDGKLWLANENILQVVDPDHIDGNRIPPPVVVEQIIADRKRYLPDDHLQLPARSRDIEIDYTALSLVVPEKVRFRYKLDGRDTEWQDPENRRRAFYSDLPPGKYQFHVIAANNDGVWNEQGTTLGFTVLPAFFQTGWFRTGAILMALGLLWLIYGLRVRQLAANIQGRFNERLEERERIARDLHDTLLQGIFSASIHFDVADKRLPTDSPAKSPLQRGLELLRQVSKEGRNTLLALRPPSSTGSDLPEALSRLRNELALPASTAFRVITEGDPQPLRPLIRDEVYLISREAVFNASRHSNASSVEVEIDFASRNLRVLIRDNGCGIDSALLKSGREGHWGLANMRERAERIGGTLEVFSRINSGTVVQLWVPGKLAFELSSSKSSWTWLLSLFAGKPEKIAEKTGKE